MNKEYVNVIEFNNRIIGLTCADFLSKERLEWFKGVINEELQELEVANNNRIEALGSHDDYMSNCCKAEMIDALIDLLYFTYGRLYEIGVFPEDFNRMWDMVHAANMKKKKGNKGRGSNLDAVKPEGWEAPEKKFYTSPSLEAEGELVKTTLAVASGNACKSVTKKLPDSFLTQAEIDNFKKTVTSYCYNNPTPSREMIGPTLCPPCKDSNGPGTPIGTAAGVKLDAGKNNLSLVFRGFSKSIPEVGWIGTFGAMKYTPNGWQVVDNLQERYESGLLRHFFALADGQELDKESGRQHLAHLAWCALALSQHKFAQMTPAEYAEYQANAKKLEQEYFEKVKKERELSEQAN